MRLLKVLAVVLALSLSLFAAESPFSGTWKLNLATSKFNSGPPPKTVTIPWTTSGEAAKPQIGTVAPESAFTSRDQWTLPVAASRQLSKPLGPKV